MKKRYFKYVLFLLPVLWSCEVFFTGALEVLSWEPGNSIIEKAENAEIAVTFSAEPERIRTEYAFSLSAAGTETPGKTEWEGNTLKFIPYRMLEADCDYLISVNTGAEDVFGNSLAENFNARFRTGTDGGRPAVVSVSPADMTETHDVYQQITIVFDRSVEWESLLRSFSLEPAVDGLRQWDEQNRSFSFTPSRRLAWQQDYTVNLSTKLKASGGSCLSADFSSSFRLGTDSTSPEISSIMSADRMRLLTPSPPDSPSLETNGNWEKDMGVRLIFSEEINAESAESSFNIEPAVPFTLSWDNSAAPPEMLVEWDEKLQWQTLYRISAASGIQDLQGNSMTEEAVYYLFVDGPSSRPVSLDLMAFVPDQTSRIILFDAESPAACTQSSMILDTSGGADTTQAPFYFDFYFTLAEGAELPFFEFTGNFLISPQNSCISVTYKNFRIFNPGASLEDASDPKPVPSENQAVVRLIASVTDEYEHSGMVSLKVFEELTDSLGNSMNGNWSWELFDEDN